MNRLDRVIEITDQHLFEGKTLNRSTLLDDVGLDRDDLIDILEEINDEFDIEIDVYRAVGIIESIEDIVTIIGVCKGESE